MKKLLLAACFLLIFSAKETQAKKVIEWHRSGGIFGLYNTANQYNMGLYDNGTRHWEMKCTGAGFNRCKFFVSGTGIAGPVTDPLVTWAMSPINYLEDYAEDQVRLDNKSGTHTIKIARDVDGDMDPDKLVVFVLLWESDTNENSNDNEFNDGTMLLTIEEIDYPF